jgi:recombinational DNA repair ATPase RecF
MTLTLKRLREKVEPIYAEVQQISDTVLRCIRKAEQSPFAVYYLDVGDDLPQTHDKLNDYLNRVVGKRYFEGSASLQWNTYLYFIRSADRLMDTAWIKAKELVEKDRVYARKFVISESELDSALLPKTEAVAGGDNVADAMSPWISILQAANVEEAVLGEYTIPKRMQLIENPPTVTPSSTISAKTSSDTLLPQISQFEFKEFSRLHPTQKLFQFGAVNLLYGANGTGKTSLLEAIELFYCGKTRRNPKSSETYRFNVLVNGKPQSVSNMRELQTLRDRNLEWYGVREEKSTKLCDGFGRFNFLNTDAAIELSQLPENIHEDLAKLIVGSDVASTWQVIEKLTERVDVELRDTKKLQKQVQQELDLLTKQLTEISTVKRESDSLRSALQETLLRNQWKSDEALDTDVNILITELAEIKAVSEQVVNLYWLEAPVTLANIESYSHESDSIIKECTPYVDNFERLRETQRQLTESVRRDHEAMGLMSELDRLIKADVEQRTSELEKHRASIAKYSNLSVGLDDETLRIISGGQSTQSVCDYRDMSIVDRKRMEEALLAAKREHSDFVKLRDHSLSLTQELREIAARILEEGPSDECPLCHTKFKPGELAHRIVLGVDEHLEAKAQTLLENVRRASDALAIAVSTEKAANQLSSFCTRMQLIPETLLRDAILSFDKVKKNLAEATERTELLSSEIRAMEVQGLSLSRLNKVTVNLSNLGIYLTDRTQVNVSLLESEIIERLATSKRQMESNSKEEEKLKGFFSQAMSNARLTETDPTAAMAKLNERIATTRAILTALKRFLPRFSWEGTRHIAEWMVKVEEVRGLAVQFQEALEKERIATKTQTEANHRKDKLNRQNKTLIGRINRLEVAQNAFDKIQTKHSLKTITESALKANRETIEAIFSKIHAPAEFNGIGRDWTLIRKLDNSKTPLTMVSTGQRSAFALAVFLAQNAQLSSGPQVILIDDPIAHVDDLNCLSFLDYLREIALAGARQIFFATASSKLASLFERKFDFLGDKFKRINLTR